jgi:hypothetical protein
MEEDFVVKVMTVRVEKAKHDDDEDNAITANDASNAVAAALRLMNMAVDGSIKKRQKSCRSSPAKSVCLSLVGVVVNFNNIHEEERRCQ